MFLLLRQTSPVRLAFFLLLTLTCYRFWFITRMEMVPDEAYYWLWSKHLAASYRDKGPAIGWTIALGTWLFGPTVFGIRFFAVVFGTATGVVLFQLARRLYDDWVALWCLVLAAIIPMFAVGSIVMTIDSLSVYFWALATLIFWRALERDRLADWAWLGLAIGAGFLAKFTNGVQLVCILIFLLWSKPHRPLLFSPKMLVLGGAFLLCSLPILWWNVQTGWVHALALHSRSGVTNTFGLHPFQLTRFVGEQFGVISPLVMAGMVVAAIALIWQRPPEPRVQFLLSQFLPLYGLFLFFSLNSAGKPNWTAPALITGIILTVAYWRARVARQPGWRWAVGAALGVALLMTLVMHDTEFLHLPPQKDPLRRAQGWKDFGRVVQAARAKYQTNLLLADHYSQASMMAFYLPDQPTTYLLPEPYGATQFTLWPGYAVGPATRALFVTTSKEPPPEILSGQFKQVQLVNNFWSRYHSRPITEFLVYLCTND